MLNSAHMPTLQAQSTDSEKYDRRPPIGSRNLGNTAAPTNRAATQPHSNVNNTNLISNSLARPPNRLIYLFSLAYKYPLDFLGCQKIKASKEGCEKLFDDEKIYLLLACCCRVATLTFTIPEEDTDTSQQRKLFFNPIN